MTFIQLVLDGVADGSVGIGLDVIGAATRAFEAGLVEMSPSAAPGRMRVLSMDGNPVRTSAGRSLPVDGAINLRNLGASDTIVLPGLGMATEHEVANALDRELVIEASRMLVRALDRGARVAASCSATFVLGASGILDGREATTTWWLGREFSQRFPRVTLRTDRMVVASGRITTAGSAFAHADLMLALLAATTSPALAHFVARCLLLDERTSQARYMMIEHLQTTDSVVRALESYINANLSRQLTLKEMALATATSPRTLARKLAASLGTTPQQFAQRIRIAHAMHLLETTRQPVDEIATLVGYADAAAFRRIFRRETGQAPRDRRKRQATG